MKRLKLDMAAKGHALLSASSSHIWLVCTPSARLAEFIEEQDSTASAEGTIAHALSEEKLIKALEARKHGRP